MATTIHEDYADWRSIKGIQLDGIAVQVSAEERTRVSGLYGAKFPLIGETLKTPAAIAKALSKIEWYKVTARSVYFVDNSVAFGHRDRIDF